MDPVSAANIPRTEMLALYDLYQSTNGDDWSYSNWVFLPTANPCMDYWTGITCELPEPYTTYYIKTLQLSYNNLLGTLPASLANLNHCISLDFTTNHILGTIPHTLQSMQALQHLYLSDNRLRGTLPEGFGSLINLRDLYVGENLLEGSIDSVVSLPLQILCVNDNQFTGSLPAQLLWNTLMQRLDLSGNHFYGVLPPPASDTDPALSILQEMYMDNNIFSGSLPAALSQLHSLTYIDVSYNHLSGSVENSLPATLQSLVLTSNRFSGTIPEVLLSMHDVTQIEIGYNCFHGTLPTALCDNILLEELQLDCLNCASACITRLFTKSAYVPHSPVYGTIPQCLFTMPHLALLYLDYNMLSGSIAHDLHFGPYLQTVDVSFNTLTGRVPYNILNMSSANVNLNNNRFSGELTFALPPHNDYLDLSAVFNRLSGRVPSSIVDISYAEDSHVHVLTGNVFQCDLKHSDLPKADPNTAQYECGSDSFKQPYITLIVAVCLCVGACACVYCMRENVEVRSSLRDMLVQLQNWCDVVTGKVIVCKSSNITHMYEVAKVLCKVGVYVAVFATLVLAPVNIVLTAYYGTYTYQYVWTVSSVLLSGEVPFTIQLLLFLLVLVLPALITVHVWRRTDNSGHTNTPADYHRQMYVVLVCSVYFVLNISVVATANVIFVSTALYAGPAYQMGISSFKIVWNVLCSPYLSRWLVYQLSASRVDFFSLELLVSLMNNVGLPIFAIMAVSPQCFFDVYGGELLQYGAPSQCDHPFHYSYQCSYVYMNYYAAAFIYVSIFTTFGLPLVELTLQYIHGRLRSGTLLFRIIDTILPRILRPIEPGQVLVRNVFRPYFDSTQFLVSQLTFLALILTLGVVSPPLAVALAVTMVATAAFTLLKAGRFLYHAAEAKQMPYIELIEQESSGVATPLALQRATRMVLYFSCCFMALFLFDTLGDAVGFRRAFWVFIVVPLLPLIAYVMLVLRNNLPGQRAAGTRYGSGSSEAGYALIDNKFDDDDDMHDCAVPRC